MAIPLIPIVLGASVAKTISDIWTSDKYERQARNANYEAFSLVESAARNLQAQQDKLESTLLKLANRKRGIMSASLPKFVDLYQKIIQLDFQEMRAAENSQSVAVANDNFNKISQMISVSGVKMSDREIICTYLFSFEYGGISGALKKDAKINLELANTRADEAEVIAHNIDTARIAVEGITAKAESFLKLLAQMNALFLKSISYSAEIINRNGFSRQNYSADDKKVLMNCINFAKAVKDILEAPLFNPDGKVNRQIDAALSTGRDYIQKIQTR